MAEDDKCKWCGFTLKLEDKYCLSCGIDNPRFTPATGGEGVKDYRDGNWMDKMGCCKVCDGEIPDGHTDNCDLWKKEQERSLLLTDISELKKIIKATDSQLTALRRENEIVGKAYEDVKEWAHRIDALWQTLIARCDDCSDGAPDASELGKFCNEMIGLSNDIQLGEARTTRQEHDTLTRRVAELEKDIQFYKDSMVRVAAEFDITSVFQLVGEAKDNSENYVDILIRIIKREREALLRKDGV